MEHTSEESSPPESRKPSGAAVFADDGEVGVAVELAVPVASGREGQDLGAQPHEVLRLAGEDHASCRQLAVVQRAYAQRVARGDELVGAGVVDYAGELRVEHGEHVGAVLAVHGQQDLAVGAGAEAVAHAHQLGLYGSEAVQLAVADAHVAVEPEGLHAVGVQPHDGQPVEAQPALAALDEAAHIRTAREGSVKTLQRQPPGDGTSCEADYRTHINTVSCTGQAPSR